MGAAGLRHVVRVYHSSSRHRLAGGRTNPALLAAVADDRSASAAAAVAALPLTFTNYDPQIAAKSIYDEACGRYRLLFDRLQPMFGDLLPGTACRGASETTS